MAVAAEPPPHWRSAVAGQEVGTGKGQAGTQGSVEEADIALDQGDRENIQEAVDMP